MAIVWSPNQHFIHCEAFGDFSGVKRKNFISDWTDEQQPENHWSEMHNSTVVPREGHHHLTAVLQLAQLIHHLRSVGNRKEDNFYKVSTFSKLVF